MTTIKYFDHLLIEQIEQAQHDFPYTKRDPYAYAYEVDGFGFVVKVYSAEAVPVYWQVGVG